MVGRERFGKKEHEKMTRDDRSVTNIVGTFGGRFLKKNGQLKTTTLEMIAHDSAGDESAAKK